jgi:hypothetical protein
MIDLTNESKCLASLAVFRALYDKKASVYGIIQEFLTEIITSLRLHEIDITEITEKLNTSYDFEIPEAVVKTALSRLSFLTKDHGKFILTGKMEEPASNITQEMKENTEKHQKFIIKLFSFIEEKTGAPISEKNKEEIVHSTCAFLMNQNNGDKFSSHIAAFFISEKDNEEFRETIKQIREGVVLHTGLKFNADPNDTGSWTEDLTICIDTDILFIAAGYNGKLNKQLFEDLIKLIREANYKKRLIHLGYFSETKDEIERFFSAAEAIVRGEDKLDRAKTAMSAIVNGCKDPSEIIDKKLSFYKTIDDYGIRELASPQINNSENHKFNIISQELLTEIKNEAADSEAAEKKLNLLNYIAVQRKTLDCKAFEKCQYIFLTRNRTTINISLMRELKPEKSVPLATRPDFLTDRIWFKLNKGFGSQFYPKSFDAIAKAQIILSNKMGLAIEKKYKQITESYENGNLTLDQALETRAALMTEFRYPEEIEANNLERIIEIESTENVEEYIKEHYKFKEKSRQIEIENKNLKETVEKNQKAISEKDEEHLKKIESISTENKITAIGIQIENHNTMLQFVEDDILHLKDKEFSSIRANKIINPAIVTIAFIAITLFFLFAWKSIQKLPIDKESIKQLVAFSLFIIPLAINWYYKKLTTDDVKRKIDETSTLISEKIYSFDRTLLAKKEEDKVRIIQDIEKKENEKTTLQVIEKKLH